MKELTAFIKAGKKLDALTTEFLVKDELDPLQIAALMQSYASKIYLQALGEDGFRDLMESIVESTINNTNESDKEDRGTVH
tara:strand:+ start:1398 stop:1640 length:243 start_codon:yes stop_codon:yes gene_type:complete